MLLVAGVVMGCGVFARPPGGFHSFGYCTRVVACGVCGHGCVTHNALDRDSKQGGSHRLGLLLMHNNWDLIFRLFELLEPHNNMILAYIFFPTY